MKWLTHIATMGVLCIAAMGGSLLVLKYVDPDQSIIISTLERAEAWYYIGSTHYCPICESYSSGFAPRRNRRNVECTNCGSRPRHRRDWLYIRQHTNLLDGTPKNLLHVAPEEGLEKRFQQAPNIDYLSADLDPERAMVAMDITDIQYPDDTFDVIYCSHVLEHVPDDRRAMRELYRVLKPGGWAIINAPISRKTTLEDPSITSPEQRARVFGQWNHVRRYGEDYTDRLRESGFEVSAERFVDGFSDEDVERLGLHASPRTPDSYVYVSRKPAASGPAASGSQ